LGGPYLHGRASLYMVNPMYTRVPSLGQWIRLRPIEMVDRKYRIMEVTQVTTQLLGYHKYLVNGARRRSL